MAGERTLPGLGLTGFWNAGDNTWKPGMDANLRILSAVVQLRALSRSVWPPNTDSDSNSALVADGDIYLVPDSDSNSMQDSNSSPMHGAIAIHDNGAWVYIMPQSGWLAYIVDEDAHFKFDGADWVQFGGDASAIEYSSGDGGDSNSTQTNVADALDDLYGRIRDLTIGAVDASTVGYSSGDGGDSNSVATTVQEALDDLYGRTAALEYFYDIPVFIGGQPDDGELVFRMIAARPFTLDAQMVGSYASAVTGSTGNVDFTVSKNGTPIGTVNFNNSSTGVFVFEDSNSADISFAGGDILTITAPATQDATLEDVSITMAAMRP